MEKFTNVEAIFFDLDGTLVDTDDHAVAQWVTWLRPLFKEKARPAARLLITRMEQFGAYLVRFLDWVGLDHMLMAVIDWRHRRQGDKAGHKWTLVPGVKEMLLSLNGRYKIGLVTIRSRYHIDAFFAHYPELAELFATSCGVQETRYIKPSPMPVLYAANQVDVPVENCLMVGDTGMDMVSARAAGAWALGVLCGFGDQYELEQAGAHLILNSTADLLTVLD